MQIRSRSLLLGRLLLLGGLGTWCAAAAPVQWGVQASLSKWTGSAADDLEQGLGNSLGLHAGMPVGEAGGFRARLEWRNQPKDRLAGPGHTYGWCLGFDYLHAFRAGRVGPYAVAGLQYGGTWRNGSGGQGSTVPSSTPSGF